MVHYCEAEYCGTPATKRCSRCAEARYCSAYCQRRDWYTLHKYECAVLASQNASKTNRSSSSSSSSSSSKAKKPFVPKECVRCRTMVTDENSECRVGHPEAQLEWKGSCTFVGDGPKPEVGFTVDYLCTSCGESIVRKETKAGESHSSGSRTCYRGRHCFHESDISEEDTRRKLNECVLLVNHREGDDFQPQITIDELPDDVESLVIRSVCGYYESNEHIPGLALKRRLPNLKTLRIWDVDMAEVELTDELTPQLERVEIKSSIDKCAERGKIKIVLSELRYFKCDYYSGPGKFLQDMLDAAVELMFFKTYKLYLEDHHELAIRSFCCVKIDLSRASGLFKLTLATPSLQVLQICGTDLNDIEFQALPKRCTDILHPSARKMYNGKYGDENQSPLRVIAEGTHFGPRAEKALQKHPRIDEGSVRAQKANSNFGGAFNIEQFQRMNLGNPGAVLPSEWTNFLLQNFMENMSKTHGK